MKLGAQGYTIRNFAKTEEDIKASFEKLKNIGYKAVQISGFARIEPELLKAYADEYGLEICATHNALERFENDVEGLIREHKLWGCKYIGIGGMPEVYRADKEGFGAFLKKIETPAKKIADAGLKFVYHNHCFELAKIDGDKTGFDYLADNTSPDYFGFLADFYWIMAGGMFPVDFIEKYADRVEITHFKDMAAKTDNTHTYAEIFNGNMNYNAIYNACMDKGVKWAVVEQDICPGDPFDSLKLSFDNLKNLKFDNV